MLSSLAVAFVAAAVVGAVMSVAPRLRVLIGVGTGICGASAIAAVSSVVGATEIEIAYAISTIFVFNLVAVLCFPLVGHGIGLSQKAFGLWAGTAVNDTSSVAAAAYAYGRTAGSAAIIVKLARTLMIVPVTVAIALINARRREVEIRWLGLVPWFIVWFIAASTLHTTGPLSSPFVTSVFSTTALVLTTAALSAIGLSTQLGKSLQLGFRPLALGATIWAIVAATSLAVQRLTGIW